MEDPGKLIAVWGKGSDPSVIKKRRRIITLGIVALVVVLLVVLSVNVFTDAFYRPVTTLNSSPDSGDWAMFGRDLMHSASVDSSGPELAGTTQTILSAGGAIHSSPAIANGILYFGSRDGKLYAIEEITGDKLWEFQTGSWVESSPAIVDNVVYFGSNDGHLYAVDAHSGSQIWAFSTKYPVKSTPAVADGRVFFGCDDYAIYAVNTKTGKRIWRVSTSDSIAASPAVANGIVFAGSMDGNMYAIDARSGRVRLTFPAKRAIISSPAVQDDVFYFSTSTGIVYAMDGFARNWLWELKIRPNWQVLYLYGALPAPPPPSGYLWSIDLSTNTSSSPAMAGDRLYIGAGSKLISIDIQSQEKVWEFSGAGQFNTMPVVVNDTLYATNENGHLYAVNANTGEGLKDITVGGKITSSPVVVGDTVYVSSEDGNFYAVK